MITIFQVITMEGWAEIMYMVTDTSSSFLTVPYFCLIIIIGSFFLLNLILAVIMRVFTQNDELERIKHKQKKIIEETKKLRKDPKTYLRPLNIKKIKRSNSAVFVKKYTEIDMNPPESPTHYKVNVKKAKLLKMKSSMYDFESRNFANTAEKLRNVNAGDDSSFSASGKK